MKRLLMVFPLAIMALATTQAHAAPLTDGVPSAITCVGKGGYYDDPQFGVSWRFRPENIEIGGPGVLQDVPACAVWSSDTAKAPSGTPPLDPDPFGILTWLINQNAVLPVGHHPNMNRISANGTFACGDGTLDSSQGVGNHANEIYWWHGFFTGNAYLDWSSTLSDGVGTISGTAEFLDGRTRDVTGTIVVDDGAASGECDDSAYNSDVLLTFILS